MNNKTPLTPDELKRLTLIGMGLNLFLAVSSMGLSVWWHSYVLLGVAVDSLSDSLATLIAFAGAKMMQRPPDKSYPYGYARAETVASKFLAVLLLFLGLQLIFTSAKALVLKDYTASSDLHATIWLGFLALMKMIFSLLLLKKNRERPTRLIRVYALNYIGDSATAALLIVGLYIGQLYNYAWMDQFLTLFLGLGISYIGFKEVKVAALDLMDGVQDHEIYDRIFSTIQPLKGVHNPHKLRVRKMGEAYFIEVDVEVDPKLTIEEAHILGQSVEDEVRSKIPEVADVLVHLEPLGNDEHEAFGVNPADS